jgi:hypothetical protein
MSGGIAGDRLDLDPASVAGPEGLRPPGIPTPAPTGLGWGMNKHTSPGNPRVAVAYLRASQDEQRLSPEAQRAGIEAWAEREGLCVAAWCVDQGVRSVSPVSQRPALSAALAALRRHGAGILVVAKRDRIARDVVLGAGVERAAARAVPAS